MIIISGAKDSINLEYWRWTAIDSQPLPIQFHDTKFLSLHHYFVSQTLSFMEQLLDYSRIVGEVLQGQSSFAVSSSDDQRNVVLGKFLSKCLLC